MFPTGILVGIVAFYMTLLAILFNSMIVTISIIKVWMTYCENIENKLCQISLLTLEHRLGERFRQSEKELLIWMNYIYSCLQLEMYNWERWRNVK